MQDSEDAVAPQLAPDAEDGRDGDETADERDQPGRVRTQSAQLERAGGPEEPRREGRPDCQGRDHSRASGDGGGVTAKKQDSSQALSDRLNQLSVIKNISASKTSESVLHFRQQEEKEQTFMLKTTTDCEQTV